MWCSVGLAISINRPWTASRRRPDLMSSSNVLDAYDQIFIQLRAGGVHRYAVVAPHHGLIAALRDAGLIQAIDLTQISHWPEIDSHFQLPETTVLDGQRYGVPLIFGTCPAIYNADLLPEPPANWTDLNTDAFDGKVAMFDDGLSHFNLWGRAIGSADRARSQHRRDACHLPHALRSQASAGLSFHAYPNDLVAQIANGKALISTTGWEGLTLLPERGAANIRIARLAPGDFSFVQVLAIPAETPICRARTSSSTSCSRRRSKPRWPIARPAASSTLARCP